MSNMVNVVTAMNSLNINVKKNDMETDTSSLSSTTSNQYITTQLDDLSIQSQLFQLKYEDKYTDFVPYREWSYNLKEYPAELCRYEKLPKNVFGKIEIKDKYNNRTIIYGTFKKRHIRVKMNKFEERK